MSFFTYEIETDNAVVILAILVFNYICFYYNLTILLIAKSLFLLLSLIKFSKFKSCVFKC